MFTFIGQIVVGLVLLTIVLAVLETLREVYRAFKVTNITGRLIFGKRWWRHERITVRNYARTVWREIFSDYTYAEHGGLRLYRDGRITREAFYSG